MSTTDAEGNELEVGDNVRLPTSRSESGWTNYTLEIFEIENFADYDHDELLIKGEETNGEYWLWSSEDVLLAKEELNLTVTKRPCNHA